MNQYLVYKAISPSGRIYFGKTNDLTQRKMAHISSANRGSDLPFHRAIRKYQDAIQWDIYKNNLTEKEAFSMERGLIKRFNTLVPNGYNVTIGGDGVSKEFYPEDMRRKISLAKKGKTFSRAHKLSLSKAKEGKPTWNKGKTAEEDTRILTGRAHPNFGIKFCKLAREKMSISQSKNNLHRYTFSEDGSILTKLCNTCEQRKPIQEFFKTNRKQTYPFYSKCKKCCNAKQIAYRKRKSAE